MARARSGWQWFNELSSYCWHVRAVSATVATGHVQYIQVYAVQCTVVVRALPTKSDLRLSHQCKNFKVHILYMLSQITSN